MQPSTLCALPPRFPSWRVPLIRHLEEEQKRQLLDVVAVGQPVIAEDVAVVPEFLNELLGLVSHAGANFQELRRLDYLEIHARSLNR